jgi:hypothetical protein
MAFETSERSSDSKGNIGGALPLQPRFLLVMTATITPAVNAGVRRSDPALRMEDYKRALRYWLGYEHPSAEHILLLENSGADLKELEEIAAKENPQGKRVEILSVPGNRIPEHTNYGYTEMELLDNGLAQSKLRRETTHMIKVTGRLTFPAIGKALDLIQKRQPAVPLELMVDCRKLGFPRRGFDAKTQIFVCSHEFYDRVLRDSRKEMNATDVRLLEHLIFRKVIPYKGQVGVYLRFPCNVEPVGYSGFKSRRYNSVSAGGTNLLRSLLRKVAPNYWF